MTENKQCFLPPLVLLADGTASGPGGPLLPTAPRTTCFAMRGSTRRLAAAHHGPCCLARCVRPASAVSRALSRSYRPQRSARRPVPVRPNEPLVPVHPHQMQEVVRGTRSAHGTARRCRPLFLALGCSRPRCAPTCRTPLYICDSHRCCLVPCAPRLSPSRPGCAGCPGTCVYALPSAFARKVHVS